MAITKLQAESLNLADDFTFTGTVAGAGESNVPAFLAKLSSNGTTAHGSNTKVAFNTEEYDTNSAYDTSNYRFTVPAGQAGKYCFYWNVAVAAGDNLLYRIYTSIYKNGSNYYYGGFTDWTNQAYRNLDNRNGVVIVPANAGDYFECYVYIQSGGIGTIYQSNAGGTVSYFGGYKLTT